MKLINLIQISSSLCRFLNFQFNSVVYPEGRIKCSGHSQYNSIEWEECNLTSWLMCLSLVHFSNSTEKNNGKIYKILIKKCVYFLNFILSIYAFNSMDTVSKIINMGENLKNIVDVHCCMRRLEFAYFCIFYRKNFRNFYGILIL